MAFFNQTLSNGSITGDLYARLRETLRTRIAANREFRRTYDELHALNDRDLADLGIARSDIGRIAKQTVYGGAAHY